ncbi:beta-N-acetylhexosaminidase [Paenibacillus sp. NPDC056579]|uniref:beta-N-acetylhexosaminidase n=1 Tax=Paenibacillus sp. NPDC056579 TaxID=3345871 RepID=UPI0036A59F21
MMADHHWTLKRKIGQMVMCGFHGTEPSDDIARLIRDEHIGGVIYFRRNLRDAAQARRLSTQLQQLAGGKVQLLIAIDQEGGMVNRIDNGVTIMPGAMALGAARNTAFARQTARAAGEELKRLGINMNFAPCLDVNNNPANPVIGVRSYGENPQLVGELGSAAAMGYQEAGVAATVKHFPGHGDTGEDSHLALPLVPHGRERLERVELAPFRQAIAAGVDAIMTAHVMFPAFEPERVPCTLSGKVLTELLRRQLGFTGVVVTDCLEMGAIADHFGVAEGAVRAVEAGADLILVSHRIERQQAALAALLRAVEQGRIPERRIDESVTRILAMKRRRGLLGGGGASAASDVPAAEAALRLAETVSERSVTLVKEAGRLPLDAGKPVFVVWPEVRVGTEVDEVIPQTETLGFWLQRLGYTVREERIGVTTMKWEADYLLQESLGYEQVVVLTYNAEASPQQVRLVKKLEARGISLIVASVRIPYDLNAFPHIGTYIACYENRPSAMRALASVLAGRIQAFGKLPVTIRPAYPYGWSWNG